MPKIKQPLDPRAQDLHLLMSESDRAIARLTDSMQDVLELAYRRGKERAAKEVASEIADLRAKYARLWDCLDDAGLSRAEASALPAPNEL